MTVLCHIKIAKCDFAGFAMDGDGFPSKLSFAELPCYNFLHVAATMYTTLHVVGSPDQLLDRSGHKTGLSTK